MSEFVGHSRKLGSASVVAALLLASGSVLAQTPPPAGGQPPTEQPPPAEKPHEPGLAGQAPPTALPTPTVAKTYPAIGPVREIKITDHFAIKMGLQIQFWAESLQSNTVESDGDDGGYQNNLFVRRGRVLLGAQPWDNINIFVLLEGSNIGKAVNSLAAGGSAKTFASNLFVDAYADIKFSEEFQLMAGLFLVPTSRNLLQGTTTYISLDVANTTATHIAGTATTVLRDTGLQLHGYLLGQKLDYRLGVYSGVREPTTTTDPTMPPVGVANTAAQNSPLLSAYLQYNFLDVDKGYVYNGYYYGRKRIAGVSVGGSFQKRANVDPYIQFSAAAFLAYPLAGPDKAGGDEVVAIAQFQRYDGGGKTGDAADPGTIPGLRSMNTILAEAGYYNKATKLSVFGKFETRMLSEDADQAQNQMWFGGGIKYHLVDNLMQFTAAYFRTQFPDAPETAVNDGNQFVLAIQALYY